MKNVDKFAVAEVTLGSAVANSGTFDVPYPSGTSQNSFNAGLNGSNISMWVNNNDKYDSTKFSLSFGASVITVTNSTGASLPAGSVIRLNLDQVDGNDVAILAFPVELASITGTQDVVTDFRPGFDGTIEDVSFAVDKPVTTGSKLATLTPAIGGVSTTGGAVALTSAGATPMGKVIQGSAVTAANVFTRDSKLSIKATSVTAFAEGNGTLYVRCRRAVANAY